MSGYRWRGWTPRHEALRRWANAQWEHDQRSRAQATRRGRVAPEVPSPASGTTQPTHPNQEATP
jgi:hypothetical protein